MTAFEKNAVNQEMSCFEQFEDVHKRKYNNVVLQFQKFSDIHLKYELMI